MNRNHHNKQASHEIERHLHEHESHEHRDHRNTHEHHDHHHDHDHDHHAIGHVHVAGDRLKQAIVLGLMVLAAELIGGIWANSLALLSDAGHMLTDVAALIVAYWAIRMAKNPPNPSMTYGYHRVTILAALFNALTLIGIAVYIGFEAYRRMLHPEPVKGAVLLIAAFIGLIVNLYIGLRMREHADNINIKSAMLHVLGDAAASAGVIVAGVLMQFTGWYILDPLLSVMIALIVAWGAVRVIKEALPVLLEATPAHIEFSAVSESLLAIPNVKGVHDLHIWSLTSNRNALSAHVVVDGDMLVKDSRLLLQQIEKKMAEHFRIGHVTIQFEDDGGAHEQDMFAIDQNWRH
ncbi:MAG TPA: cation diffusion facilitator family transporter [Bacilli bacterium]